MRDNSNYNAFRNRPHRRLRSVFTSRVYATLTAGNADGYAPRNAVVRRELRQLGPPSPEKEELVYAEGFPCQGTGVYAQATAGYVRCLRCRLRNQMC